MDRSILAGEDDTVVEVVHELISHVLIQPLLVVLAELSKYLTSK